MSESESEHYRDKEKEGARARERARDRERRERRERERERREPVLPSLLLLLLLGRLPVAAEGRPEAAPVFCYWRGEGVNRENLRGEEKVCGRGTCVKA